MLSFLAARAIPGVEEVRGDEYIRSFDVEGPGASPLLSTSGTLRVAPDGNGALVLEVTGASARALFDVVRRVRRMLDLDADPLAIDEQLGRSELLRESVRARPGLRVVGAVEPFEGLVRAMVGQQVSVAAARTFLARIASQFGGALPAAAGSVGRLFPTAEQLAQADLTRVGLTGARAQAIREISRQVAARKLSLAPAASLVEVVERLKTLPGLGEWTAQVVAMRAFAEPDAFPASDLALRRALHDVRAEELERIAEAWRPWRAYAAMHLWALAAPAEGGHGARAVEA
jgi:AraC family transcriptional regulator of adaptative response / DNA-3-methyladenine glycosylase II